MFFQLKYIKHTRSWVSMGLFGEFRDIRHYCNCLVNPGLALNEETMYVHYIYTGCPWFSLNLFHYLPFIRLTFLPINKQQFIFKIIIILSGIRLSIFIVNYIFLWQNSTPRFASTSKRRNENINLNKYFTSSSGDWTRNQSILQSHFVPLRHDWP